MRNIMFIIALYAVFLNTAKADYLFQDENYCAIAYENQSSFVGDRCKVTKSSDGSETTYNDPCEDYTFIDGYIYNSDDDTCTLDSSAEDASILGLTLHEYNFLMGLTANLLGFTMVFLVGFLFVLQGRR